MRWLVVLLLLLAGPAGAAYAPDVVNTTDTNATMKVIPTAAAPKILRLGVNAPWDAGEPALFRRATGTCSVNNLVDDIGSCVNANDGNSWIATIPSQGLDARQFGADPSGTNDSKNALQAWGNWASGGAGRTGWLAAGSYKILSPLSWSGGTAGIMNWSLRGAGRYVSRIVYQGTPTNVDIVSLLNVKQVTLSGWSVDSTTTMTGGAAVHLTDFNYGSLLEFSAGTGAKINTGGDLSPAPKLWNGIWFENTAWNVLNGSSPYVLNDAILVNQGVELKIDNTVIINHGNNGIHVAGGFGGLYLGYVSVECVGDSGVGVGNRGLLVDNSLTATTNLQFFISSQAVFDFCKIAGAVFNDAVVQPYGIKILSWGGWAGGSTNSGSPGLHIQNWNNGQVRVAGTSVFTSNAGSGMAIGDASAFVAIDPGAVIGNNRVWGVACFVQTANIISDAGQWLANDSGNFDPNCLGTPGSLSGSELMRGYWPTFTPVVQCGGTGTAPTTSSSSTGTYSKIGKRVHLHYDVTLSSTGTCSNSLEFGFPVGMAATAATFTCSFHGRNMADGMMMQGFIAGPDFAVQVQKYDASIVQSSGARIFLDGECQTNWTIGAQPQ